MTDATPAPAAEGTETATVATTTETTAVATPAAATSDTDAANSAEASASAQPGGETSDDAPEVTALSKEERRQYSEALKALPPEHRKTFNRILDFKNKAAADERKRAEDLVQVKALVDQIGQDPEAAIKALSERFVKPKQATTETAPAQPVKQTVSPEEVQAVEDLLPEESKPLAKVLAPVVKAMMGRQLEPVFADLEARQQQARVDEATRELEAFESEHPDWKEFEPQMVEWSKKIPRADGLSMRDYTKALYVLASASPKQAAATKAGVEKALEKVAKAAAAAEPDTSSVSPARVVRKVPSSIYEAHAMALRGEEVEAY